METQHYLQIFFRLLSVGTLQHGDVVVLDNFSINFMGDCQFMQHSLIPGLHLIMTSLPPYYSELNATEFVCHTLVERIKSALARCGMFYPGEFRTKICRGAR